MAVFVVPAGFTEASSATEPPLNSELGRLMLSSEMVSELYGLMEWTNVKFYFHGKLYYLCSLKLPESINRWRYWQYFFCGFRTVKIKHWLCTNKSVKCVMVIILMSVLSLISFIDAMISLCSLCESVASSTRPYYVGTCYWMIMSLLTTSVMKWQCDGLQIDLQNHFLFILLTYDILTSQWSYDYSI